MSIESSVRARELSNLIHDVHKFHAQPVFEGLGPAIAQKKFHFRIIFALVRVLGRSRVGNLFLMTATLLLYGIFRYPEDNARVFQYGVPKNNVASFRLLNQCLPPGIKSGISTNARRVSFWTRLRIVADAAAVWQGATMLSCGRHERPLVHLQAVIACSALVMYRRFPLPASIEVVCVANDHSPVCLALLYIARLEGRRTCYVQHAPVTEKFPPLIHSLSILYDRASVRAYRRSEGRRCVETETQCVLLPPFQESFCPPRLGMPPYTVGICLSFLPDLDRLSQLIIDLSENTNIDRLLLRSHPRCRLDISAWATGNKTIYRSKSETLSAFIAAVDIVLVPNSGVAIEALHNGRPTFFTPGVDWLDDDSYGFVAEGVVPVFDPRDLVSRTRLVSFFDGDWKRRFGDYDETVHTSPEQARENVSRAFCSLLSGDGTLRCSSETGPDHEYGSADGAVELETGRR